MREIKFRAWSKHENLMGEVTGLRFSKSQYPFLNVRFRKNGKVVDEGYYFGQEDGCDSIILMQYTGLKDKNGKEIYEGDIFRTSLGFVAVVKWDDDNGRFLGFIAGRERRIMYVGREPAVEVIGNIHENPELLEVG